MSRSSPAVGTSTEAGPSLPYGVIVTLRPTTGSGGFSKNRTIKERFFIVFRETPRAHHGSQRYDNTIRETQLCLCRGAHYGAQTGHGSASVEPSLPRGLDGGFPPKSHAPFCSRFSKKFLRQNSLARSDESVVKKPTDRKVYFLSRRPVESRDDLRPRATALPRHLSPMG